jgi:hypothetical protein
MTDLFRQDTLKMKNAIYPVYRDTQVPHSNIRYLGIFMPAQEFCNFLPQRFGKPCFRKP